MWTWQDTRDEFGEEDRGGSFPWGGFSGSDGGWWGGGGGGNGGGGIIEGEDHDCGCDAFHSDGDGNENWHSDSRPDGKSNMMLESVGK